MIYKVNVEGITAEMLEGFFVGWPNPPSPETHLKLLIKSDKVVLAFDVEKNRVVGFITAISDGVLSAYIPFLEVLPEYQNDGIGKILVEKMLQELENIYMIDIMCDEGLQAYYQKFGMIKSTGVVFRNYDKQSGI
ncbi:GNAT family N-acetyltransferase [Bacillus sp. 31A1R]|uniref:GNAT family N-acetyltransferase n=1 Tax=Robertmurraya mangrovi TaxID=3098077 RepID=A0ABU5J564_9BACI|nr:GNAT family N-acetyltransferase [Bacillus sp. 31A1R]MDZ5474490.1 GNAT family N-acetyltransferase [Bacillus sp. 31A1R]